MIGTLTFAVMAATMAATPCEGLKSISLPNTTITTPEFVQEGVYTPPAAPRGGGPAAAAPAPERGAAGGDAAAAAPGNRGGRGGGAPAGAGGGRGAAAAPPAPVIAPAHCRI